ncbi:MAG: hypothetical protein AAFQ87_14235 [Bacteroidota bacterium]
MKRALIVFSLFANVFIATQLHAQSPYRYSGGRQVIAPSGVKLRKTAGLKAEKIGVVPFRAEVEILDSMLSVFDTVDYIDAIIRGQTIHRPLVGGWLKVRYQSTVGYVFAGLLGHLSEREDLPDFMVWDVGFACEDLTFNPRRYHWYGLFPGEQHTSLRKINPTIYDFGEALPSLILTTGEKKPCLTIIASLKPLPSESLRRPGGLPVLLKDLEQEAEPVHFSTFSMIWKDVGDTHPALHCRTLGQDFGLRWAMDAYDQKTLHLGGHPMYNTELIWHGDLNNDGYLDLLIRNEYEYGAIHLFLGGPKKMHNVATLVHGACC